MRGSGNPGLSLLGVGQARLGKLSPVDCDQMADSTKPIYLVQRLEGGRWHDTLTTTDKAKAEELLKQLGDKGRVEVFRPRPNKRR